MATYEAVIGYTEDPEIASWGVGIKPDEALRKAVERFIVDQLDYIEPGDYEATVYCDPLTRYPDDGGESEIVGWTDRGTATVNINALLPAWTIGPIVWDGKTVTP